MKIARRHFLRGAGALVALPHLESLAPRRVVPPRRAVWLYFPNGVSEGRWEPETVGPGGELVQLNASMLPLQRHVAQLVLPKQLWTPEGNDHGPGTATWLTGGDWDPRRLVSGGPSVDQLAARALGADCVAPALSLSTRGEGMFSTDIPRNSLSWHSAQRPVFRETDPRTVFQLLFGEGVSADTSLLDSLRSQAALIGQRVSRPDRERLDAYLEAIRGVERRLAFVQEEATRRRLSEAREHGLPFDAKHPPVALPEDHGTYLDLMLDLTALALWSGASRVATLMLDHGQSNRYCTFVPGVRGTWHSLSHWKDASGTTEDDDGVTRWGSIVEKRAMYDAVVTWHHERVARFLDQLAALPEGEGTLLDQTLVVYGSSIADGHDHGWHDLPLLLAGKAGGAVRTGRVLECAPDTSLSRLHLATLHALGVPSERFADADVPLDLAQG